MDSYTLSALLFGLLSAASLPMGALVGTYWRPPNHIMAFLLAFGGGALLAALTIDLMAPGIVKGHFPYIAVGALLGGVFFKTLDYFVNQKGGYLRKPSTAINFLRRQTKTKTRYMLGKIRRIQSLQGLSLDTLDKLANIVSVREYPAGAYLYRAGDHPSFMYVIESGNVELLDPEQNNHVFARLGSNDVFGRMSFFTGLHRKTEAKITQPVTLMCIPRKQFFELLDISSELQRRVADQIQDPEIKQYLMQRWNLSEQEIAQWIETSLNDLQVEGSLSPPIIYSPAIEHLPQLLQQEKRLGFFSNLSAGTLKLLTERMAQNTYQAGFVFFTRGDLADRCYLLTKGSVYLIDAKNHCREPIVVQPGEMFGTYSFLTAGPHSMTAIGHEDSEVWELRSEDFQELWDNSPEVRARLSKLLEQHHVEEYLTEQQGIDTKRAALWLHKATKSVSQGDHFPSVGETIRNIASQSGAPLAMFLGILLDGIPESLVIGAEILVGHGMSLSLIGGLFLANFPEALSSSAGMRDQGFTPRKILTMWFCLMLMTGMGAALGVLLLEGVSHESIALIKGLAAGAMLTMVAETMLPEAFHNGSSVVGLSTLSGFLVAILVNQV